MRLFAAHPRFASFVFTLGVFGAGVLACNGMTASTSSGGTGDDAGATDGGPGPRPADCPASLPDETTSCSKVGLLCEYGDDYNPLCNTVRVCSSGGHWASPVYYGGSAKCPSSAPSVPPNPPSCPATREAVPEGTTCSTTANPDACNYATGSTCTCGVYCPSSPVEMPPCDADAGRTTSCCDTTKVQWNCFDGPPPCGASRPRIGAACTKSDDACAIDPPMECGQTVLACQDGVWNLENNACPISTARAKHDIRYVETSEEARLKEDLMKVRLAEYRYKSGDDSRHLGFIIEDMPEGSPAVLASRDRVDLYGYVSMTVATVKEQEREIEALKREIAELRAASEATKTRKPRVARPE